MLNSDKNDILSYPLSGVTVEVLEVIATTRKGLTRILKVKMEEGIYIMKVKLDPLIWAGNAEKLV